MTPINKLTNPLDYVLNCCEQGLISDKFNVLNAKDELKRMRQELTDLQNNEPYANVAWARINNRGDLYDLTLHYNRFDEEKLIPLYSNKEELKKWLDSRR